MSKQKVVLFCRSATKAQLAFQIEQLKQYAGANNCEVVAVVAERCSGVSTRRWKLNLAMRIAQKHSAGILTPNISRVSRRTQIAEKFLLRIEADSAVRRAFHRKDKRHPDWHLSVRIPMPFAAYIP